MLKALKAWFAEMRRRFSKLFSNVAIVAPPPPPPPPPPTGVYLQYAVFLRGF